MNPIATLSGSKGTVWSIAISPDGKTLASGSGKMFSFLVGKDNTVRIWNLASKEVIHSLKGHSDWVYSVAFSPDGQTLASGSKDNTIKLWDVRTGQELHSMKFHSSWVEGLAVIATDISVRTLGFAVKGTGNRQQKNVLTIVATAIIPLLLARMDKLLPVVERITPSNYGMLVLGSGNEL